MAVRSRQSRRDARPLSRALSPARLICTAAFVVFAATACASSSSAPASGGAKSAPNLITADEIAKVNVQTAFDAVQKLRPTMLRRPSATSTNAQANGELVVYVDNTRFGPVENLRSIPANTVAAVRYYSASESQMKWGSNHPGGVIEVLTKR
jgi:hypothetical protein